MRVTLVTALVLSTSVLSGEAARTRISSAQARAGPKTFELDNAEEIAAQVKKIDWSRSDAWAVFQTDGKTCNQFKSSMTGSSSTLDAFKDVLINCGPRGYACFGVFKFNYPPKIGISTEKGRSVLIYDSQPDLLTKKLGMMGKMKVVMGTTAQVWPAFKRALHTKIPDKETSDPAGLTAEVIWDRFPSTNVLEKESFLDHVANMVDHGGNHVDDDGGAYNPNSDTDHGDNDGDDNGGNDGDHEEPHNSNSGSPAPGGGSGSGSGGGMDARATQRLVDAAVKKAKAEMREEIEEIAERVARSEIGMALRKMGTDVGTKITDVGKLWATKSGR